LLHAILSSWNTLVLFFKKSNDKVAGGFMRFLTNAENLKILAHLADILTVFSRYQQQLQSDSVTIIDIARLTENVKAKLFSLVQTPLLGGWASTLQGQMESDPENSEVRLKGIELHTATSRRKEHHKFVTDRRDSMAVTNEVIQSLVEFLTQRFSADDRLLSVVKPFINLNPEADLKEVHRTICSDLDIEQLGLEYGELLDMENLVDIRQMSLREVVRILATSKNYLTVTTALSRLLAAKPHSADVERLISASNLLKSPGRSKMNLETENLYLFIHYNMPPLYTWDPKPAVLHWMQKKAHRVRDREKGKAQEYFLGIFPEASAKEMSSQNMMDDDPSIQQKQKKCNKKF
jgi:hypothetical protein